jgi:FkbM family methyltransferase
VEPGDCIIDVGADVGIFAIHAGRSGAHGYLGFEPNYENYRCARFNARLCWNGHAGNVKVCHQAVSDKFGRATFYIGNGITAHGLIDRNLDEIVSEIETVTLDSLWATGRVKQADYLKVDCNGSEAKVFDGLSADNLARLRKISVQYHHVLDDLRPGWFFAFHRRLREAGFATEIKTINVWGDSVIIAWRSGGR